MEFLAVASHGDFRAQEIYKHYCKSFAPDERRSAQQYKELFKNPRVKIYAVLSDLEFIGYLICWELTNFVFVEHFEIFSQFRGRKFGTEVVKNLFRDYSKILLEAEPEDLHAIAGQRISFYEKNGFRVIDQQYVQPAYSPDKNSLDLWLLGNFEPENIERVKEEIYDVVYCI